MKMAHIESIKFGQMMADSQKVILTIDVALISGKTESYSVSCGAGMKPSMTDDELRTIGIMRALEYILGQADLVPPVS